MSIRINGKKYRNGTIVRANPVEEATGTLEKIGIGSDVYEIQGGGGGNALIMDAQIYSEDEQVVGVWTDGKPLYQKTIILTSKQAQIDISGLNIDTYVKSEGVYRMGDYVFEMPRLADSTANYASYLTTYYADVDSGLIAFLWGSNVSSIDELHITLQYTKTTDVAGSGGYQAYGFSPVIYSTEEREIGVWVDNKPLYAKTISHDTTMTNRAWTQLIDDSNITIKMFDGCIYLDGYPYTQINYHRGATATEYSCGAIFNNGHGFQVYPSIDGATITCKVTLYYTKTTDTAGSGSYTTLGVPNVPIYTLSERVLGLNNYTLNLTHSDGTVITQTITSSDQIVNFEITKPGIWTLSNTKDSYTKTYTINTTSDIFAGSIVSIIPILSNNTGSNGVAIAPSSSPNYGDGNAWWAFDNSFSTELEYLGEGQRNAYIGYIFNNDVYIDNLKAWMGNYSGSNDFSIQLQITLDGSTWTTVNTFKVAGYSDGTYGEFDYDLRQIVRGFRYYSSTLKNGGQNWKTYEIQAWGSEL